MVELKNIFVSFDEKTVLHNFLYTFPENGVVLITGPSGCGKTTLLRVLTGLIKPDSGVVNICGKSISVVFQEDQLVPTLTALQNVEIVSNKSSAIKWLDQLKLSDAKDKYPTELSGGMKRRVALARALSFGGDILLLDEAFSGIDDELAEEIIRNVCEEYNDKLIIAVTHRPELFSSVKHTICPL